MVFDVINEITNSMNLLIERTNEEHNGGMNFDMTVYNQLAQTCIINTTEQAIAELISGESELLRDHNIIG